MTFCVVSNSAPAPTPQTLTISATGTATQFDDNGVPASGIKVQPANGNTASANTVTVSIDPSFYAGSGSSYSGYIQVLAQSNGYVLYVPVTVTVDANCSASNIAPTPSSVVFPTLTVGTSSTPALSFTVAGPSVQVSATNPGNGPNGWFTASQPSGNSQTVTVTPNPSLLTTPQTYMGSITLAQVGNSANTVQVPVSLTITAAGATTITYSPNPANFTIAANTTTTQQFTINLSGPNTPVTISLLPSPGSPVGWIQSAQVGSQASLPSTLTVMVNPESLQSGSTYTATINITPQTGTPVSIPVSVTLGSSTYSVNPTSLTFAVPAGSTSVTPQNVTLSGPSGVNITASATITNGSSQWLSVSPTSGTTNGSYSVSLVNPGNFTPGLTYTGAINFMQGSTTVASVPVTVNVGATNTLTISPSQLNFQYQIGTTAPATQTITVTSPANTAISYSTGYATSTCGNGWIVVSPSADATSGTIPRTVNVSLNTTALVPSTTPTTCNGTVTITAPAASTMTTNIPVSVLVSNSPLLVYSPTNMSFNYTPGGTIPSASNISLASTSSTSALTFSTTVNPATSGGPVFVTVTQTAGTSGTTPATLSVALTPSALANLAGGTYTDNIVITDNSTGNPNVVIPVTLTVSSAAMFVAAPSSLTFNYQIGTNFLPSPTIVLSSTGAPLQFNASAASTSCGNFLFVSPTAGSTSPSTGTNGTPLTVTAAGITSMTSPVTCHGTITITSTSGATLAIPVTLNVVNQPVIDVGTTSISQNATTGSTMPILVGITLTSSDNTTMINYSATATTTPAGGTWLSVTPQNFHTPVNLNVTLNPTGLAAGVYSGSIIVTDLTNSSPVPTQTIPVTFIIASPVTANPTSLTFTAPQGGAAPAAQTITLTGVPSGVTIAATPSTASCGNTWLQSSVTGNTVTVTATPTGLLQSQSPCSGQVSIVVPNAPNSPLNIPVTFNITSAVALTLSTTTANFTFNLGSATPAAQMVTVSATGGAAVPFTAAATTQSGGAWLTVTPTSGTTGSTPVSLSIGLDPNILATLGVGTYQGTVTVASTSIPNGSVTVNVTLMVSMAATPMVTSIVNAATQQPGAVAPGEIVTLYGANTGPTPGVGFALTSAGTVPTTLAGAQVFFDNTPAPLLYVGANQINAIVPYEVAGRLQTNITVSRNGVTSTGILQAVTSTSPGIFTQDSSGKGVGSILNQDQSVNGPNNPAAKGSVISIYGTGEGQITPAGVTGSVTPSTPPFPKPNAAVSLNFLVTNQNGSTTQIPATSIFYAGEAPALVSGVLQVNAAIPATVPTGAQTIVLTVGANSSPQTVTVYVQ